MHTDPSETHAGLRAWAKGIYPLEAGVELLIRACGGRFANASLPWVQPGEDPGWWWIDVAAMNESSLAGLSGGEARMVRIAASLLGGSPVNLYDAIPGLDRDHIELLLAAIAHSSGSHEHSGPLVPDAQGRFVDQDGVRMSFERLGSLYPWPT